MGKSANWSRVAGLMMAVGCGCATSSAYAAKICIRSDIDQLMQGRWEVNPYSLFGNLSVPAWHTVCSNYSTTVVKITVPFTLTYEGLSRDCTITVSIDADGYLYSDDCGVRPSTASNIRPK